MENKINISEYFYHDAQSFFQTKKLYNKLIA